jgi:hypothetical protein
VPGALLHDHSNFAARALCLQTRFQFRLSDKLRRFVTTWHDSEEYGRQTIKHRNYSTSSNELPPPSTVGVESMPGCAA